MIPIGTEARRAKALRGVAKSKATLASRKGVPLAPLTAKDRAYDADEEEFLRAVAEFRSRTAIRFPTLSQYLYILKGLGYRKGGPGEETPQ